MLTGDPRCWGAKVTGKPPGQREPRSASINSDGLSRFMSLVGKNVYPVQASSRQEGLPPSHLLTWLNIKVHSHRCVALQRHCSNQIHWISLECSYRTHCVAVPCGTTQHVASFSPQHTALCYMMPQKFIHTRCVALCCTMRYIATRLVWTNL